MMHDRRSHGPQVLLCKDFKIILRIPLIQDVIEHLVICHDHHAYYSRADVRWVKAMLTHVKTLEMVYDDRGYEMDLERDGLELFSFLLNACVPETLRNITIRFHTYELDSLVAQLQDANNKRLQKRILHLSPQSVSFDASDPPANGRRISITEARMVENVLEQSFPELYRQGIAKTVAPKSECKFILGHTKLRCIQYQITTNWRCPGVHDDMDISWIGRASIKFSPDGQCVACICSDADEAKTYATLWDALDDSVVKVTKWQVDSNDPLQEGLAVHTGRPPLHPLQRSAHLAQH